MLTLLFSVGAVLCVWLEVCRLRGWMSEVGIFTVPVITYAPHRHQSRGVYRLKMLETAWVGALYGTACVNSTHQMFRVASLTQNCVSMTCAVLTAEVRIWYGWACTAMVPWCVFGLGWMVTVCVRVGCASGAM